MPKEAEEEDEEDNEYVVHVEVARAALDVEAGFAQCVGVREGRKQLEFQMGFVTLNIIFNLLDLI